MQELRSCGDFSSCGSNRRIHRFLVRGVQVDIVHYDYPCRIITVYKPDVAQWSEYFNEKNAPCHICDSCGEILLEDHVLAAIDQIIDRVKLNRSELDVVPYAA